MLQAGLQSAKVEKLVGLVVKYAIGEDGASPLVSSEFLIQRVNEMKDSCVRMMCMS